MNTWIGLPRLFNIYVVEEKKLTQQPCPRGNSGRIYTESGEVIVAMRVEHKEKAGGQMGRAGAADDPQ